LENTLTSQLGLRVQVRSAAKKGKGRLVIHYSSLDQFDQLLERLGVQAE
jgi:predicted transcriptional regulator